MSGSSTSPGGRALGFALPGLPLLVCGSNGSVAWGLANIPADVTRLVAAPDDQITERTEIIQVRGADPVPITVHSTPAGPVLPEPVLGAPVALQWNGLRLEATDLRWTELLEAHSALEACAIAHGSGSPPLAMIIIDADSSLVQTVSGRYPNRTDTELLPGFIDTDRLPTVALAADDVAVWANDPPPHRDSDVGTNVPASYRRFRIAELLETRDDWDEPSLFAMQRDAHAGFYTFYHDQALQLTGLLRSPLADEATRALLAWDGRSGPDSLGIALLVAFRARLVHDLMARLLHRCAAADPAFRYTWRNPEPVLRRLLRETPSPIPSLLDGSADWSDYLAARPDTAAQQLAAAHPSTPLSRLRWRDVLQVEVPHPLGVTWLTRFFSLRHLVPEGGLESIAAYGPGHGPVQRLIVSPGHEYDGLAQMPGGQSGVVYSSYYRDQHRAWRTGRPTPLQTVPDDSTHRLPPPIPHPHGPTVQIAHREPPPRNTLRG
ncbi:penicillin acylase family protein [Nocardia sp. R7R-8]|uniref:penicillin acylase family protein n=1 Tax=Nocardia sp. R7R-8 TaxID=3459304 RepID=UPI00403E2B08